MTRKIPDALAVDLTEGLIVKLLDPGREAVTYDDLYDYFRDTIDIVRATGRPTGGSS